jgi:hypothetical protein
MLLDLAIKSLYGLGLYDLGLRNSARPGATASINWQKTGTPEKLQA